MLIKEVQSDRCANFRIHNPLVAGPKLKTIEKTPDDPWGGASLPAAAAAPSMDPWSGWKPQGGKPATAVGGPKNPQKIDAPIAAKFQSVDIGSELGGYVLDITKCFNGFGRIPSMWMMQSNGMTKKLTPIFG